MGASGPGACSLGACNDQATDWTAEPSHSCWRPSLGAYYVGAYSVVLRANSKLPIGQPSNHTLGDCSLGAYNLGAYSLEAYSLRAYSLGAYNDQATDWTAEQPHSCWGPTPEAYSLEAYSLWAYSLGVYSLRAYSLGAYSDQATHWTAEQPLACFLETI